jgi:hypothetical protein
MAEGDPERRCSGCDGKIAHHTRHLVALKGVERFPHRMPPKSTPIYLCDARCAKQLEATKEKHSGLTVLKDRLRLGFLGQLASDMVLIMHKHMYDKVFLATSGAEPIRRQRPDRIMEDVLMPIFQRLFGGKKPHGYGS